MKGHTLVVSRSLVFFAPIALVLGVLVAPTASQAQNTSQVARSGPYTFTLKVLPPESFHGSHAEMTRDSGAKAVAVNGPAHPNYHLVVFIKKNGKPVEDAQVAITYRQSARQHWERLPVARMHVAGKGRETTHYGNNVNVSPGKYEVRVTVAGRRHATFRFTLKQ
ncbi:MAG: hypothetical protein ACRD4R_15905 [Candidatus Acidiferrales bacterium]